MVLTREWGPVKGYDRDEVPTHGDVRAHRVSMVVGISAADIIARKVDVIEHAAEKAWRQAVDRPRLPTGWAILRGVGEPDFKVIEHNPAGDPLEESYVRVRVQHVWIARYVGR